MSRGRPTELVARPERPRRDCRTCTPPPPGHIRADQLWAWTRATGLPPFRRRQDEKGSMTIEFLLCLALIIFPVIGLSAAALNWPGRLNAASGAAYEAAHSVVHSPAADPEEGRARAVEVWTNHGYDAGDIEVAFEGDPTSRGRRLHVHGEGGAAGHRHPGRRPYRRWLRLAFAFRAGSRFRERVVTGPRRPRVGPLLRPVRRRDEAGFTMVIWTMGLAVVLFAVIYLVTDAWRLIAADRALSAAVDAAAAAGANGIDEDAYPSRRHGEPGPRPGRVPGPPVPRRAARRRPVRRRRDLGHTRPDHRRRRSQCAAAAPALHRRVRPARAR